MNTSVLVAIIALCGTVVTVAGGVIVAIVTSTKERKGAAETALEKAWRERLLLRDEQIQDLREELKGSENKNVRLKEVVRELQTELAAYKADRLNQKRGGPHDAQGRNRTGGDGGID